MDEIERERVLINNVKNTLDKIDHILSSDEYKRDPLRFVDADNGLLISKSGPHFYVSDQYFLDSEFKSNRISVLKEHIKFFLDNLVPITLSATGAAVIAQLFMANSMDLAALTAVITAYYMIRSNWNDSNSTLKLEFKNPVARKLVSNLEEKHNVGINIHLSGWANRLDKSAAFEVTVPVLDRRNIQ